MFVIIGWVLMMACVFGVFIVHGGNIGVILKALPFEMTTIFGAALAHAGVGLCVLGVVGVSAWHTENTLALAPGQSTKFAGYEITLRDVQPAAAHRATNAT